MTELEKEIEQHLTKWFDGLGIETHQIKNSVRELVKISTAHTRQQVLEARIDELSNHVAEWLVINNETFDAIKDRIAQLKFKGKNL